MFATCGAEIARQLVVARRGPGWLELRWRAAGDPPEVLQPVDVSLGRALGREWIRISAVACAAHEIDAREMLAKNHALVVGAVATLGDSVLVRHQLLLPLASSDELRMALLHIPKQAAWIRQASTGSLTGADILGQYAE